MQSVFYSVFNYYNGQLINSIKKMDNVAKYLKYESTKYSDLPSILGKLESQGYLNDIYGLFRKIYEEESSFTMQGCSSLKVHMK